VDILGPNVFGCCRNLPRYTCVVAPCCVSVTQEAAFKLDGYNFI